MKRIAIALLTGLPLACAHAPGGFLIQRSSNTFDVFVGGAVEHKEDAFYNAAYDVCRKNFNSGFEVTNRLSDDYSSIEGTVVCKGPVDKFLAQKYAGTSLTMDRSDIKYQGGFKYQVIPATK